MCLWAEYDMGGTVWDFCDRWKSSCTGGHKMRCTRPLEVLQQAAN